ncbi:hypothetical protein [Aurantibacillus circumpalustris]|uniref:hypothetical protein n=1 Tax=Aurantibacillus circumpalustris TaxID=3036359 RepID=UPI00295B394A|nr:hypothetical protein [Aurantibacillus circumpalustris]
MEKFYLRIVLICIPLLLFTLACKKKKAFDEENGQAAEDVRRSQEQNDEAVSDVNIAIMEQSLLRGGVSSTTSTKTELCGLDIDSLEIYSGILQLKYNGTVCKGLKKTGTIRITLLDYPIKKWKNQECRIQLEFINYKVSHNDGRTVQFDGAASLTNQTGNTWYEMKYLNASNLIQIQTASGVKVTIDESNTAIFNINRSLTFNYNSVGKFTSCKIEGLGVSNGINNLENWGQNRDGNNYTSQVNVPIVWKSTCGSVSPSEGEVSIKVDEKDFAMICNYGVNSEGLNSTASDCPYGWKVSWSYKSDTNTRVFAYN